VQIDQRVQDVADALDTQRHKLADLDFGGMPDAVLTAAHDALPRSWQRPKQPSRWPLVAGALILATVVAGFFFLLPTWRLSKRTVEDLPDAKLIVDDPDGAGEPLAQIATAFQLEEQPNGEAPAI
jgi:hypothetical protein